MNEYSALFLIDIFSLFATIFGAPYWPDNRMQLFGTFGHALPISAQQTITEQGSAFFSHNLRAEGFFETSYSKNAKMKVSTIKFKLTTTHSPWCAAALVQD